jgi:hypothetical protein
VAIHHFAILKQKKSQSNMVNGNFGKFFQKKKCLKKKKSPKHFKEENHEIIFKIFTLIWSNFQLSSFLNQSPYLLNRIPRFLKNLFICLVVRFG